MIVLSVFAAAHRRDVARRDARAASGLASGPRAGRGPGANSVFWAPVRLPRIDSFERLRHGGQHFEPDIERTMLADGSGPSMMSIARPGMRSTHDMAQIVAAPAGPCEVRTERGKNRRVTDSRRTRDAGTARARESGVGPYGGRGDAVRRGFALVYD